MIKLTDISGLSVELNNELAVFKRYVQYLADIIRPSTIAA